MNTGIFPAVCRPLYPTEGFYSISIEIELNARIEKKSLTNGKCMYIEYVCLLQSALISTQCKQ